MKLVEWFKEHPQIAAEWDSEANTEHDVNTTGHAVRKKAWWKCEKGHKWQAMIYSRTSPHPPGCPVCAGLKAYAGYNDLVTTRPDVLSKWDYEKNTDVSPTEITESSHKKVWWKCEKGHSWYARVQSVTGLKTDKSGCPYCSKVRVYTGESDLLTRFPELAKEWCYDLNDTPPDKVSYTSPKYYWWKCEEGHTWESSVSSRTKSKLGCPYCSGKRAIPGVNDLATVNPQLASEWHDELNGDLKPTDVFPGTHKYAWWKCSEGHVWEAYIPSRAQNKKTGCPYCYGRRVIPGVNDLATVNPQLASEWHDELNGDLKPTDVLPGTHKKAWWKCSEGHVWETYIYSRTRANGSVCPICAGRKSKDKSKTTL